MYAKEGINDSLTKSGFGPTLSGVLAARAAASRR